MSNPVIPICGRIGVIVVRTAANLCSPLFLMAFVLRAEEPIGSTLEVYYKDSRGGTRAGAGGPSLGPTLVPVAIDEGDAKRLAKRMEWGDGIKPEISRPGYARYTALPQGEWVVELSYGSLNMRNCVAWESLTVNGKHHKIRLVPESGRTLSKIYVKWDDALPSEIEHAIIQVRRVLDGEADPYWRQWLHYRPKAKSRVELSQEAIEAWAEGKSTAEDVKASNQGKNGETSGRKDENHRLNGSLRYVQVGRTYELVLFAWKPHGQKKFRRRQGLSPVFDSFPQADVPLRYRTRIEIKKGLLSPLVVVMKDEDKMLTRTPKDSSVNEDNGVETLDNTE